MAELPLVGDPAQHIEQGWHHAGHDPLEHRAVEVHVDGKVQPLALVAYDGIPLRRSVVRVADLTLRVLDVFATQARSARVSLSVKQREGGPAALQGDEEKLAWVLMTLVGSALRIVSQPSRSDVEPKVTLDVGYDASTDHVRFEVSDNGPGMAESTARWLFERDPHTGKAVGLGLLMVKDVVVAHGGTIAVESRLGHGATFRLAIPRSAAARR